jgi:hypothetical protein
VLLLKQDTRWIETIKTGLEEIGLRDKSNLDISTWQLSARFDPFCLSFQLIPIKIPFILQINCLNGEEIISETT